MKQAHLIGASLIAMIAAGPAFAQTQSQAETQPPQGQQTNNTNGPSPDAASNNSGDIIVTATKRALTLQDTPVSVSVTTAQSIEQSQVRDLIDLQTLVPSLKVGQLQSSSNTNFIIRGFGNGANNIGIEPAVAVFIDNVYRSRSAAQIADLPNIDRVEVLRGPQSTLFGKNASAGVISIVTAPPSFKFGGNVEASYGNFNAVVLKGSVTGPLTDTIAVSLAGNYNKRDGYANYINLGIKANDRNRYGGRAQILFQPTTDFKVRLIADYDKIDEICCTVSNLFDGPTGNAVRALGGQVLSNQPYAFGTYANYASVNKIDNYGVSGQIDYNLRDNIALTSVTAYRGVRSFTNQDSDFTSADIIGDNRAHQKIDTFTQELRLSTSFSGPLNFLIGGFYFNEKVSQESDLTFGKDFKGYANLLSGGNYSGLEPTLRALLPGTPAGAFGSQGQGRFENYGLKDESISAFGQVDFKPFDHLTLTAGFNYTDDTKRASANDTVTDVFSGLDLVLAGVRAGVPASVANTAANPFLGLQPLQFIPPFLNFPNAVESGRTHDTNFSYTLRAAYKFDRHLNAYVTYATGFKPSSFNLSTDSRPFTTDFIPGSPAQSPAPAASAIRTAGLAVTNLTTGTRYAGPEKSEVYEVGVKANYQGFSFNLAVFKQNIKGFQSNVFVGTGFQLRNAEKESVKGFEFDTSVSPSRELNFTASVTYLDPNFDLFSLGTTFNPATNSTFTTNLSGKRPSGIATWAVAVGGTYTLPIFNDNHLILHTDYQFDSATLIAQGLPYKFAPETLNASVTLQVIKGLEITAFGRNLTSPRYNPVIFPSVAQSGSLSAYPSPPATYGGSVRFRF